MPRQPILFVSHGSPQFALNPGRTGQALQLLGSSLPPPKAILVVSPHWSTSQIRVATHPQPETIHDFAGFPAELYRLQYPAPGAQGWAQRTIELLRKEGYKATPDDGRGLDHGAWVPLRFLYPMADVPVYQMSLPTQLDGFAAYALGKALSMMSDEGVMIVGSGSLTHNLYDVLLDQPDAIPEPYALQFGQWVKETVLSRNHSKLQLVMTEAPHAHRAHPTAEHLWPLLIAAGAAGERSSPQYIDGGVSYGVLSMDACVWHSI